MAKRRRDGTWEEPRELKRLRAKLTDELALTKFQELKGRPPHSDTELEVWREHYTLELYNSGYDEP